MNTTTTPVLELTSDQYVRIAGRLGGFAVFTIDGWYAKQRRLYPAYAAQYSEANAVLARAASVQRGEITEAIMKSASVISCDRKGMAHFDNAPTIDVGSIVRVDGADYRVEFPRPMERDDFRLTRLA